jgi:hypothetical protein
MTDSSIASMRERLDGLLTAPCNDPEPLSAGRYVIYGAGARGRETLSILRARGCEVAAFIDRSATGWIDGVPVVSVVDPAVATLARDGCAAIVAVFNPGADPLPIHDQLEKAGFRTVIGVVEARQRLAADDAYWLASTDTMTPSASDAVWLFEKLADDLSRATFLEAIALRRTRRPEFLRSVTPGDQYFPSGVPIPRTGVRFVDGGAFDGDTIAHLIEAGFVFEGIAAFEPDPTSSFRRVGGLGHWRMRGSGFAMAATNGWNPMLKTEQTPRPRTPAPQLLTDPRQVDTLLRRPSAPKRFGGCSSGKSCFFKSTLT